MTDEKLLKAQAIKDEIKSIEIIENEIAYSETLTMSSSFDGELFDQLKAAKMERMEKRKQELIKSFDEL